MSFANDIIVVAAAGNTPNGVPPGTPYPNHFDEPSWQIASWAAGFNVLVCGSYVDDVNPQGVTRELGWPSPFTRIGPGICASPKPTFSAPGGNWNSMYQWQPGLGVNSLSPDGMWEDQSGTSLSTPIVAREAAKTLQLLGQYCDSGVRPFGVTVRAFLTLTATKSTDSTHQLCLRTLGYGLPSCERMKEPSADSAVMIWQGTIAGPKDLVRINVPIPRDWLASCSEPRARLVVCSDPPVNDAVNGIWACRKVSARLRPGPDSRAIRPVNAPSHSSYPVIDRFYRLNRLPNGAVVSGDMWLVDLFYDEIADYYAGMVFTPSQRVGVVFELFDDSAPRVSPQNAIQSLTSVDTMTRLSRASVHVQNPVIIRSEF